LYNKERTTSPVGRTARAGKTGKKRLPRAPRIVAKFKIPADVKIEYKNLTLLYKFMNDRGKILPHRLSGVTAKEQRKIVDSIKKARFLGLMPTGGVRK
jgi:small subunit ribosomal protein S18